MNEFVLIWAFQYDDYFKIQVRPGQKKPDSVKLDKKIVPLKIQHFAISGFTCS